MERQRVNELSARKFSALSLFAYQGRANFCRFSSFVLLEEEIRAFDWNEGTATDFVYQCVTRRSLYVDIFSPWVIWTFGVTFGVSRLNSCSSYLFYNQRKDWHAWVAWQWHIDRQSLLLFPVLMAIDLRETAACKTFQDTTSSSI